MKNKTSAGLKIICLNRKASFNYFFEDIYEAGIVLKGSEIKSVRNGKANIAPKLCSDMQKYSKSKSENELKEAERIDQMLQPLHKALFIESNPAPAKYAAKLLGLCEDEIRLPLVKIKKETQEKVKKALSSAKLIS